MAVGTTGAASASDRARPADRCRSPITIRLNSATSPAPNHSHSDPSPASSAASASGIVAVGASVSRLGRGSGGGATTLGAGGAASTAGSCGVWAEDSASGRGRCAGVAPAADRVALRGGHAGAAALPGVAGAPAREPARCSAPQGRAPYRPAGRCGGAAWIRCRPDPGRCWEAAVAAGGRGQREAARRSILRLTRHGHHQRQRKDSGYRCAIPFIDASMPLIFPILP